ncbi:hypothetical protein Vafri_5355, partial [Volvox africanus]
VNPPSSETQPPVAGRTGGPAVVTSALGGIPGAPGHRTVQVYGMSRSVDPAVQHLIHEDPLLGVAESTLPGEAEAAASPAAASPAAASAAAASPAAASPAAASPAAAAAAAAPDAADKDVREGVRVVQVADLPPAAAPTATLATGAARIPISISASGAGAGGDIDDQERHRQIQHFQEATGMDSLEFIRDLNVTVDVAAAAAMAHSRSNAGGGIGGIGGADADDGGGGESEEIWEAASQDELAVAAAAEGPGGAATRAFTKRFESRAPLIEGQVVVPPTPPPSPLVPEPEALAAAGETVAKGAEVEAGMEEKKEEAPAEAPPSSALQAVLRATAGSAIAPPEPAGAASSFISGGGGGGDGGGGDVTAIFTAERLADRLEEALPCRTGVRETVQRDIALLEDLQSALAALRAAEARGAPPHELSAARGALLSHMSMIDVQLDDGYRRLDGLAEYIEIVRKVRAGELLPSALDGGPFGRSGTGGASVGVRGESTAAGVPSDSGGGGGGGGGDTDVANPPRPLEGSAGGVGGLGKGHVSERLDPRVSDEVGHFGTPVPSAERDLAAATGAGNA